MRNKLVKVYLLAIRTICGKEFESVWVGKEVIRSAETCGMQTEQTSCGKEFARETGNFTDFFNKGKAAITSHVAHLRTRIGQHALRGIEQAKILLQSAP
jgi:hypothetical protein